MRSPASSPKVGKLTETIPKTNAAIARIRAEGEANAEVMRSLRDVFGQNSVHADGRKQQRHNCEDGHQNAHNVHDGDRVLNFGLKRFQFRYRNFRIDLCYRGAGRQSVGGWIRSDAKHKPERAS